MELFKKRNEYDRYGAKTDYRKRSMTLYEKIANQISEMIHTGVLKQSEKLPSLRKASQIYGVSPATVQQAYFLLETQGVIYAKERSGFYINPAFKVSESIDTPITKFSQNAVDFVEDLLQNHSLSPQPYAASLSETSSAIIAKPIKEQDIEMSDFIFSILESHKDASHIPFGSAFPSPELFPINHLTDSMAKSLTGLTHASYELVSDMPGGSRELARQIELRYRLNGLRIERDELVITSGAMEALSLSLQATTKPGDLVAIEAPCFYAILQILERLQLKAIEIPVDMTTGMDIAYLEDTLNNFDVKAIVLMTKYQNPTGCTMPREHLVSLYDLVKEHQVPVIVDDVYSEVYYDSELPAYLKELDDEGLVLHCDSFCKSLAPGFRVGWVAGRYAKQIERLKLMTTISPSVPSQLAISHYLKHRNYDRHLMRLRAELQKSQERMLEAIAQFFPSEVRATKPMGGYFLWVTLPKEIDALELYRQALAEHISIAPGPIFSASQEFRHHIRLNYGLKWSGELDGAMATLGQLIEVLLLEAGTSTRIN